MALDEIPTFTVPRPAWWFELSLARIWDLIPGDFKVNARYGKRLYFSR